MNTYRFLETCWHDFRYGLRLMKKTAGITLVALISLSLGIGATTAIFSVVYGVLIAPYPYDKPGEIWTPEVIDARNPRQGRIFNHAREFIELSKVAAFGQIMATRQEAQLLGGDRSPESFTTVFLTANAHQFLGVKPELGRTILPSDVRSDGQAEHVIVLSYKAWLRLFDGNREALGKTLRLNDETYTVIGVMPPRFGWFTNDGGWLPMAIDSREDRFSFPIVRLAPGVTKAVAEQQLTIAAQQLAKEQPNNFPKDGFRTNLRNYLSMTVASGEMRSSLNLLFGAVGFLLLIACANVANLQMARATSRAREIALRMSIGAQRSRVLRQLLTESVVLSLAGGALGIFFAVAITKGVVALMPEFYVPNEARITVNIYVLLFCLGVSILTGILFGLVPALQCSKPDLVETLKETGRGTGNATAGGRTRSALVVIEVALSVILLVGASMTIRGFINLQKTDLGFQPERVLTVSLQSPLKRYVTHAQRVAFAQNVLDRVRTIPGVQYAAMGNGGLPFGGPQSPFAIDGVAPAGVPRITIGLISADYPQTLGVPLRAGRVLTDQEVIRAEPFALINETAAKLWPAGQNPIGRQIRLNILEKTPDASLLTPDGIRPSLTIVGILADTKNAGLRRNPDPAVYIPYTAIAPAFRTLAIRTQGPPTQLLSAVRQQVQAVDKDQPVSRAMTLEEIVGFDMVQPRFNMALFTFFGMLGLALAAVGIFGVLSYSVALRTREIGIRIALGAERRDVLGLMLAMGGKLVLAGLVIGIAASAVIAKLVRSEVFQVSVTDPAAIAGVVVLLGTTAFLASFLPARRAARLDPMSALRHQ